jgi:hypothetical protein
VTAQLQGVCPDADLSSMQAACAGGPDTPQCVAAFQVLVAINPACAGCLQPFNEPFNQLGGIYRCVAPFVNGGCNRNTGCASDCQRDSCDQCPPASEDQCRSNAVTNHCGGFFQQTAACVSQAIGPGQPARFCNPVVYFGGFGAWLRAVGDRFCGNGP